MKRENIMRLQTFLLIALLSISSFATENKLYYGTILKIENAMSYQYLKVKEDGKELWVAIAASQVKVGDKIGYDKTTIMKDFKSKTLKKTFKEVIFASDVQFVENNATTPKKVIKVTEKPFVKKAFVKKEFYTVEELFMWKDELKNQTINIKGKISKISRQIMKLDWVHIVDGTGEAGQKNNDIIFTSKEVKQKTGDEVIATGKVIIDKDFGFGYFYKVIIQESSFKAP